jgi:nucleoside-diphosphate-sugar epimerase
MSRMAAVDEDHFGPLTVLPTRARLIQVAKDVISLLRNYLNDRWSPNAGERSEMKQRRLLVTGGSGFIGANFINEANRRCGDEILNLDLAPPKFEPNTQIYRNCDLLDREAVERCFGEFQPTHVVHFAGRTDMFGSELGDYVANHVGTEHVIAAIQRTPSITNAVFTSSQFVVGPGSLPDHDEYFRPHTIYGQSKVLSEKAVRGADLECAWTIIRPTNIWGRWHPRYPSEFWRVLKQGRYFHPGGRRVTRCYGYVGNVVNQVLTILAREDGSLNGRVFYVGDAPIDLFDWTNAFSMELTGRPVRVVPSTALKALAKVGDFVVRSGGKFPIFSSRFRSMTEDYVTPMDATFAALGPSRISLETGVRETVSWLRTEGAFWN